MVSDGNQDQRSYSWSVFQKFTLELPDKMSEMALLEILTATITSIVIAGIDLVKRKTTRMSNIPIDNAFLGMILTDLFLNLSSNLYTLDSRNIFEDSEFLEERTPVLSDVINFCKFLILTDAEKLKVRNL